MEWSCRQAILSPHRWTRCGPERCSAKPAPCSTLIRKSASSSSRWQAPAFDSVALGNGVPHYPQAASPTGKPEVLFAARMHPRKRPVAFVEMAKKLLDDGVRRAVHARGPRRGRGASVARRTHPRPPYYVGGSADPRRRARADGRRGGVCAPFGTRAAPHVGAGSDVGRSSRRRHQRLRTRADGRTVAEWNRHRPRSAGVGRCGRSILADRPRARSMGERGRATVHTHFGMRAIGDRLLESYAEVAEGRR